MPDSSVTLCCPVSLKSPFKKSCPTSLLCAREEDRDREERRDELMPHSPLIKHGFSRRTGELHFSQSARGKRETLRCPTVSASQPLSRRPDLETKDPVSRLAGEGPRLTGAGRSGGRNEERKTRWLVALWLSSWPTRSTVRTNVCGGGKQRKRI